MFLCFLVSTAQQVHNDGAKVPVMSPKNAFRKCIKLYRYLYVLELAIKTAHNHPRSAVVAAELHPAVVLLLVHILLLRNLDAPRHVPLVASPANTHTGKAGIV